MVKHCERAECGAEIKPGPRQSLTTLSYQRRQYCSAKCAGLANRPAAEAAGAGAVAARQAARLEEYWELRADDQHPEMIAARLGVSVGALIRFLTRAGLREEARAMGVPTWQAAHEESYAPPMYSVSA